MNKQKCLKQFQDARNILVSIYNEWEKTQTKEKLKDIKQKSDNGYMLLTQMNLASGGIHFMSFSLASETDQIALFEVNGSEQITPLH